MPDPFFASDKKRKRSRPGGSGGANRMPRVSKGRVQAARDEELDHSDIEGGDIDDMDFQRDRQPVALDDDEFVDANETAAEKRVRLARGYLDKVRQDVAEGELVSWTPTLLTRTERAENDYDAAEIDRELIASRLRQEVVSVPGVAG